MSIDCDEWNGPVAVVGAGAMGTGIAQVALSAGEQVVLCDTDIERARTSITDIGDRLGRLVDRGRLTEEARGRRLSRLSAVSDSSELPSARLVIEAVSETPELKVAVLRALEQRCPPHSIIATNTSSLSVTALANELQRPERFLGLHFFNPAPVMNLVEVVAGAATAPAVLSRLEELMRSWGKTTVRVRSSPGFIVNRVARPYYGESMRLLEERCTTPHILDALLVDGGGFAMGPCALTDMIGHDVSTAVNVQVWEATGFDPRYTPNAPQRELVDAGWLGRKVGRGFFEYASAPASASAPDAQMDTPATTATTAVLGDGVELPSGALLVLTDGRPAHVVAAQSGQRTVVADRWMPGPHPSCAIAASTSSTNDADEAIEFLASLGVRATSVADVPALVVSRVVAMLVNEAADLVGRGVADGADVDLAMRLGVNYPHGPLEWGDRWTAATVVALLDHVYDYYHDPRYRVAPLLRRAAASAQPLRRVPPPS